MYTVSLWWPSETETRICRTSDGMGLGLSSMNGKEVTALVEVKARFGLLAARGHVDLEDELACHEAGALTFIADPLDVVDDLDRRLCPARLVHGARAERGTVWHNQDEITGILE